MTHRTFVYDVPPASARSRTRKPRSVHERADDEHQRERDRLYLAMQLDLIAKQNALLEEQLYIQRQRLALEQERTDWMDYLLPAAIPVVALGLVWVMSDGKKKKQGHG